MKPDPSVEDRMSSFIQNSDEGVVPDTPAEPMEDDYSPQYRVISEEKVPVSKTYGKIWKSRKEAAISAIKDGGDVDRWDTAIAYYRNDHQVRRDSSDIATDKEAGTRLSTKGRESENIVFANTTALVPAVYAKNPKCEISCEGREDLQPFCDVLEKLINILIAKRSAPGVNLKPKARKAVIMAMLTNYAYMEVGYTKKEQSSENTLNELQKISEKLAKEKNKKKIKELEAQLLALEDKVDLLRPAGPWCKLRRPHDVLIDPDANSLDEAKWIMIRDFITSDFLKVVYGKQNEDGKYESIYEPTHIMKVGGNGESSDEDLASFSLFDTSGEKKAKDYGYDSDEGFKRAQVTECWYVWDKATRRVYLYNCNDWTWPIWVWNDPYGYDDFFPITELEFYSDPWEYHARGEVTYYLDMQDSIDVINNEIAKTREYIVGKVVYNTNVLGDDAERIVDAFVSGTTRKRALGINVPPDTDISKLFAPFVPQSAQMLNTTIFDKERLIQAIDRLSSVTNVMRGVEYKTNTTNKAIESYESNTQTRLDEKIDAVEDWIGQIAWKIAQNCVNNMPTENIAALLGTQAAAVWEEMKPTVQDLKSFFTVTVVGGSALKPTSNTKKQQAAQLGQILGQFARSTPAALLVALEVLAKAYDELIISKEQWQLIQQSIMSQMQQPAAPEGANDSNNRAGEGGKGQPQQQQSDVAMQLEQLTLALDSLAPALKEEFAKMIASGMPIKEAISTVMQMAEQDRQPQDMGE